MAKSRNTYFWSNWHPLLKVLFFMFFFVVIFRFIKKHKAVAGNDPLDPFSYMPTSNVTMSSTPSGSLIASDFGSTIPDQRKTQLMQLTDDIYQSMKGLGAKKQNFIKSMIAINSDVEFKFVETYFGKRDKKVLRQWISKEVFIGANVKEQINNDYRMKGMVTQI